MCSMPPNCVLKNGENGKFQVRYLIITMKNLKFKNVFKCTCASMRL